MNKFDQAFKKYIVEDAEERAWEHRQIQDAAKKAKAMKKKGEKVNFNKLADHYGVSANDIKKACNEGYIKENTEAYAFGPRPTAGSQSIYIIVGEGQREGEMGVIAAYTDLKKAKADYSRMKKEGFGDWEDFYLQTYPANGFEFYQEGE